jgi:hypothetical protein
MVPFLKTTSLLFLILFMLGCRSTAPMHVWRAPPVIASNGRVAVAPVGGITSEAEGNVRLTKAMLQQPPPVQLAVVGPDELQSRSKVQLASYDGQPSEIASVAAARAAGCSTLLVGEVVRDELIVPPQDPPRRSLFRKPKKPKTEQLTVNWRLLDVGSGAIVSSHTVTMDRLQAEEKFPDLLQFPGDGADRVVAAVARQSWTLVSPHVDKLEAPLAGASIGRGMYTHTKGNFYANQGRWDLAENEWQDVISRYGKDKSAWHNLAMAAVAREDFALARSRLRHAESWLPYSMDESTLVWLEMRQRDYHNAFMLPPPKEGWTLPDAPKVNSPDQVPPAPPKLPPLWSAKE